MKTPNQAQSGGLLPAEELKPKLVGSGAGFGGMMRTLEIVSRRKWLCRRVPACINCGEKDQIQLEGWRWTPANWRCRKCRNGWDHEPDSDSLPNDRSEPR